MPDSPSLVELTLKEAIDVIAARAAERRTRPATYREKVALEASNVLSAVGDYVKNNDTAKGALMGGGAGALAGAGSALMGGGSWKDKKRKLTANLLGGGLAGAALGGGIGAAKQYGTGLKLPTSGPSGEGGKGGTFTDPATGQTMQIDPKVLKQRPELAEQVQKLTTPSVESRVGKGVREVADKAFTYAPFTSSMGLGVGLNESRKALLGTGSSFNPANFDPALQARDAHRGIQGGQATIDKVNAMKPSERLRLAEEARGSNWWRRNVGGLLNPSATPATSTFGKLKDALRADGGDATIHGGVTRGEARTLLNRGDLLSRTGRAKLPVVTGRNAALMGTAMLADAGRHMYLGEQDDEAQRKQLRELMSQVARETANRKR